MSSFLKVTSLALLTISDFAQPIAEPNPAKARIVFYRSSRQECPSFNATLVNLPILKDNVPSPLVALPLQHYAIINLDPGQSNFSIGKIPMFNHPRPGDSLPMDLRAGEVAYVEVAFCFDDRRYVPVCKRIYPSDAEQEIREHHIKPIEK